MKTKTYIITLSRTFPKGHPREGEPTDFPRRAHHAVYNMTHSVGQYAPPLKIHTIRANYKLWKSRIEEIQAGRAVLSVRAWTGAPYRSKQTELFVLDKDSGIGVEYADMRIRQHKIKDYVTRSWINVTDGDGNTEKVDDPTLAKNDGLELWEWIAWFSDILYRSTERRDRKMAIIHFTSFRYCK